MAKDAANGLLYGVNLDKILMSFGQRGNDETIGILCVSCREHRLEINNEKTVGEFLDDATSPDGSLYEAKWLLSNTEKSMLDFQTAMLI